MDVSPVLNANQLVEVEESYPLIIAGMVAVAFFVGILLQTIKLDYLYESRLDVWLKHIGKQLAIADAVVVVDEDMIHPQPLVVL